MRQHTRTAIVQQAKLKLSDAILKALDGLDITYVELMVILTEIQASHLKYALRAERHPDDPDKPADVE